MLCVCVGDVMDVSVFGLYCDAWSCRCVSLCRCFGLRITQNNNIIGVSK